MNIAVSITAEAEVKTCTGCKVVKPVEEFNRDKLQPDGCQKRCKECKRRYYEESREEILEHHRQYREENREKLAERNRRYLEENREAVREYQRRYYEENREKLAERQRRYLEENREAVQERSRRYYEENREKLAERNRRYLEENREAVRERQRRYRGGNRDKFSEYSSARRAARLNATPPWVNRAEIVAVYSEAARLSEESGIVHHVDHIIPLQNDYVCGLHVPWNLRPMPAGENMTKGNRLTQGDGADYFEECL